MSLRERRGAVRRLLGDRETGGGGREERGAYSAVAVGLEAQFRCRACVLQACLAVVRATVCILTLLSIAVMLLHEIVQRQACSIAHAQSEAEPHLPLPSADSSVDNNNNSKKRTWQPAVSYRRSPSKERISHTTPIIALAATPPFTKALIVDCQQSSCRPPPHPSPSPSLLGGDTTSSEPLNTTQHGLIQRHFRHSRHQVWRQGEEAAQIAQVPPRTWPEGEFHRLVRYTRGSATVSP